MRTLAKELYGASEVEFAPKALESIAHYEKAGYGNLPVCVAKTQYSLSHDATLKGRPKDFTFPIRDVRLSAGAGFLVAYAGDVMTMPGLGRMPAYKSVDLNEEGHAIGLF